MLSEGHEAEPRERRDAPCATPGMARVTQHEQDHMEVALEEQAVALVVDGIRLGQERLGARGGLVAALLIQRAAHLARQIRELVQVGRVRAGLLLVALEPSHEVGGALSEHGEHVEEVRDGGLDALVLAHRIGELGVVGAQAQELLSRVGGDADIRHMVEFVGQALDHPVQLGQVRTGGLGRDVHDRDRN